MKVIIENTEKIVELNGVPARIWEGETDTGIKVHCFITRITLANENEDSSQFEKELSKCKPPSAEIELYPLRLIL